MEIRKIMNTQTAVIAGLAAVSLFLVYDIQENKRLKTEEYIFDCPGLPAAFHGTRFVFLTDLHNNCFGRENGKLLGAIREQKPEFILLGGDMIIGRDPKYNARTEEFIKKLAEEYPVYYGNGNHELNWRSATLRGMLENEIYEEELTAAGVRFLHNETVMLEKRGQQIALSGVEFSKRYYKRGRVPHMESGVIGELVKKPDAFTILLAHTPFYFEQYAQWGADLVLSGHVHGGMVRLPLLGGVASPQYTLFPEYDAGIFTKGTCKMLLSRGLGLHTIPIRVFNRPELSSVTLRCKET